MDARVQRLTEADVTKQFKDYLGYRGWLLFRNNSGIIQFPSGEVRRIGGKGQADWIACRSAMKGHAVARLLFIELKRPGARPTKGQLLWMESMRAAGFCAEWFDCVFERDGKKSLEAWYRWYQETFYK